MSEDYTQHPEYNEHPFGELIEVEPEKHGHSHRGWLLAIFHVALIVGSLALAVGFKIGVINVHDPPITTVTVTSHQDNKTTIPRPPVTVQPNASFTWLTGAVIEMSLQITACNTCKINFTNPIVGSLPATLQPKYDSVSGWYFVYGLYVVSEFQYNVTLSGCAPAKLISFLATSNGLSWSPYTPATSLFTPTGSTFEQSAECGVI